MSGSLGPAALPAVTAGAVFDFHGVLTESALPELNLPLLFQDRATADALVRLETGRTGLAEFLSWLPVQAPTGRSFPIQVRKAVVQRVCEIRRRGIRVALLTNSIRGFTGVRWSAGVPDDMFDVVVESWREGVRKPDQAIYELTLARLRLPARRCVYFDDESCNIDAAADLGFNVVHVTSEADVLQSLERIVDADA